MPGGFGLDVWQNEVVLEGVIRNKLVDRFAVYDLEAGRRRDGPHL